VFDIARTELGPACNVAHVDHLLPWILLPIVIYLPSTGASTVGAPFLHFIFDSLP
jgi:hypothetical protein